MTRGGAWLKYGCLGAGGLVLITVLAVLGLALVTARPEQVENRVLLPEIPAREAGAGLRGGRVLLEIRGAELHVEPVDSGAPLRIEARYDVNAFALEERLDRGANGSDPWTYRASFGQAPGAGAFPGLVSLIRGPSAAIHVFLPADVPIDLAVGIKNGRAVVRLGGLWLKSAEIDLESGALDLDVNEPLREPMESLSIRAGTGGCLLNHLGNASPRRLDVSYRMGGIDMDLSGQWLADAEIHVDGGIGGGTIHLPAGVILEGLDLGRIRAPTVSELNPPTLTFALSAGTGLLELSDIHLGHLPDNPARPESPPSHPDDSNPVPSDTDHPD